MATKMLTATGLLLLGLVCATSVARTAALCNTTQLAFVAVSRMQQELWDPKYKATRPFLHAGQQQVTNAWLLSCPVLSCLVCFAVALIQWFCLPWLLAVLFSQQSLHALFASMAYANYDPSLADTEITWVAGALLLRCRCCLYCEHKE